jgi:hypothetical protein
MIVTSAGVAVATPIGLSPINVGTIYTAALAAKLNDFAISVNGNAAVTDTSGAMPVAVNRLNLGSNHLGTQTLNGHIRSLFYYNIRITNAELQAFSKG